MFEYVCVYWLNREVRDKMIGTILFFLKHRREAYTHRNV